MQMHYIVHLHCTLYHKGPELSQIEDNIGGGPQRKVKW